MTAPVAHATVPLASSAPQAVAAPRVPLLPRGVQRAPRRKFLLWLMPWVAMLVFGLTAAVLVLARGLNQTNMDNRFAIGLWIFLDLTIIALGAGAFTTGFLLYILRRRELSQIVNSAVVVGFICYSGAIVALMVDVGQPLRAWFTFWHPNVHSMLTEATFCITCYLLVLSIEYIPILLRNRRLRDVPKVVVLRPFLPVECLPDHGAAVARACRGYLAALVWEFVSEFGERMGKKIDHFDDFDLS